MKISHVSFFFHLEDFKSVNFFETLDIMYMYAVIYCTYSTCTVLHVHRALDQNFNQNFNQGERVINLCTWTKQMTWGAYERGDVTKSIQASFRPCGETVSDL